MIVASHSVQFREGEVLDIDLPLSDPPGSIPCKADTISLLNPIAEDPNKNTLVRTLDQKLKKPLHRRILDWLVPIRFTPLCLTFQFEKGTDFEISRFRGVWGRALKSLNEEVYSKIFEGNDESNQQTPRYIIRPSEIFESDQDNRAKFFSEKIDFITWGTTAKEQQILMRAWHIAANFGLGKGRIPFTLKSIEPYAHFSETNPISTADAVRNREFSPNEPCRLLFPVPLRLIAGRKEGKHRIESPILSDLIRAGITRLNTLRNQILEVNRETDLVGGLPEFYKEAMELAENTDTDPWQGESAALRRYSGRQKAEIDLAGTVGYMDLPNGPGELAPILAADEIFHFGKTTSIGLGRMITVTEDKTLMYALD